MNALFETDAKVYRQQVEALGFSIFGKTELLKLKE
jgi:hypothetical protein